MAIGPSHAVTTTIPAFHDPSTDIQQPPATTRMPPDKGSQRPRMRVNYVHIADDPAATARNQVLALLQRADTLLRGLQQSPDFNSQPILDFLSQPGRASWQPLFNRDNAPAGQADNQLANQRSTELKGLAKQVQAINSKLGALQAQLQKKNKSYADAAATSPVPGQRVQPSKAPREPHTRARLVLVPQVPVDATTNVSELCSLINAALTDPVAVTAQSGNRIPLPPIPSVVRLSAVNKTAKGNLVLIGGPQVTPQQLTDAFPYIRPVFEGAGYPVEAFTGIKWRRVCINGVPTPENGPTYTPGDIAQQLTNNNLWAKQLRMPIQPYWIRPPSTIEPGHRSTVVLTFEDEDGRAQQGVLRQKKAFLFGRSCTMRAWSEKRPVRKNNTETTPNNPAAPLNSKGARREVSMDTA